MALHDYQRKRDFQRTPEPRGDAARSPTGRLYVIQKHAARALHYDLRLELDGVLLSWAVPKGPSLDPREKRLAVQVEDHPIEYGSFEGAIPEGEYGGGTVMLWDRGEWLPLPDPEARRQLTPQEAYREGKLKIELRGQKLRGGWALVRMKGEGRDPGKNWLLIKERDAEARREDEYSIVDEEPFSVVTNRTIREIAADNDNVWTGGLGGSASSPSTADAASRPGSHWVRRAAAIRADVKLDPDRLAGARRASLPEELAPQLAMRARQVPDGGGWLHEIALEGRRLMCVLRPKQVELRAFGAVTAARADVAAERRGDRRRANNTAFPASATEGRRYGLEDDDWAGRLPDIARAASLLPVDEAVLDGMLVVLNARGASDAAALNQALQTRRREALQYFLFDVLYCDGLDLRKTPLIDRKQLLRRALAAVADRTPQLHYVDHVVGKGAAVYEQACRLGVAGLVSKRADSPHTSGRSKTWLMTPCVAGEAARDNVAYAGIGERGRPARKSRAQEERPGATGGLLPVSESSPARAETPPVAPAPGAVAEAPPSPPPRPTPVVVEPGLDVCGVRITNPGRILYPEERITKRDLAMYYQHVADWILPHIVGRPLSLYRCPSGHEKDCFFQKHLKDMKTEHLRDAPVREGEGKEPYIALDDVQGLITLAQLAVLEIHPWGCREDDIERPDRLIFDLDPGPEVAWPHVVEGALALRELLRALELASFVKTSGGKGLHVVVPLVRRCGWEELKAFAQAVARHIVKLAPHRYTATMTKSKRPGKVFIDYFRNHRGSTCVAPYSTRARAGAPVSTPIEWEELGPQAVTYTLPAVLSRLGSLQRDPWEGFFTLRQSLRAGMMAKMAR